MTVTPCTSANAAELGHAPEAPAWPLRCRTADAGCTEARAYPDAHTADLSTADLRARLKNNGGGCGSCCEWRKNF